MSNFKPNYFQRRSKPQGPKANEHDDLGDTSTLADPSVVNDLIQNRLNK